MPDYYNPLKSYPYSKNRLLIIDWASLSYHQLFALVSKKKTTTYFDISTPEDELYAWRTGMVSKLIKYVRLFNPRDILLTLEGNNVWRNDYVKDYYNNNCTVFYDSSGYYVKFDNFLYKFYKKEGEIDFQKCDPIVDQSLLTGKQKKITELPERIQKLFWDNVLPRYKGQRAKAFWPFMVDKKEWKDYKEEFTQKVSKVFRSHVIGRKDCEGDDIIYVGSRYWKDKYDSIILVSGDGDMKQLLDQPNLKLYNHRADEFTECTRPKDMLEIKVLSGDSSDNINGMALPNKKTQLGEKGATKLYESIGNCLQKAQSEGWDNQYNRNKKLIDLSFIPTHIQRLLCKQFDDSKPSLGDEKSLYELAVTEKMEDEINNLKQLGFYAVHALESVENNPNIFDPSIFNNDGGEENSVMKTERTFEKLGGVFDDPLAEPQPESEMLDNM